MAYSSITKPEDHFNTKLYTGNATNPTTISGIGFQPDWVWTKLRAGGTEGHRLCDAVRGATKDLLSNTTSAESTNTIGLKSFDSDGYVIGNSNGYNFNSGTFVSWNWLAGGTAPAITYSVKVVSDSGNKYRFDDFGTSAVTLDLQEGGTYTFDQSDSSNSGHPLRFATAADAAGGTEYTTGVTTTGTPGSSGAQTVITVAASAPTLYYYCTNHSGMGGQANTNSTFGSSNFGGSIQANVSANTTAGFSIVSYTGTGSNATVGHGLGAAPAWIIFKRRDSADNWTVYHQSISPTKRIELNSTGAAATSSASFNDTAPTTSVFSIGNNSALNASSGTNIAYCFVEKAGYSKFDSYTGNGNSDGTFIYTGFKPAWLLYKRSDDSTGRNWQIYDNKRSISNELNKRLRADTSDAETTSTGIDFTSNGFKLRTSDGNYNASGANYIYMCFAENPFVANNSGTAVPVTAR